MKTTRHNNGRKSSKKRNKPGNKRPRGSVSVIIWPEWSLVPRLRKDQCPHPPCWWAEAFSNPPPHLLERNFRYSGRFGSSRGHWQAFGRVYEGQRAGGRAVLTWVVGFGFLLQTTNGVPSASLCGESGVIAIWFSEGRPAGFRFSFGKVRLLWRKVKKEGRVLYSF